MIIFAANRDLERPNIEIVFKSNITVALLAVASDRPVSYYRSLLSDIRQFLDKIRNRYRVILTVESNTLVALFWSLLESCVAKPVAMMDNFDILHTGKSNSKPIYYYLTSFRCWCFNPPCISSSHYIFPILSECLIIGDRAGS